MACFAGPEIVNDGLVLHLDAANERSYSGSGTTWYDLSGFNNHCTLRNSTTHTNGLSMVTDGVDDYVDTPRISGTGQSNNEISWCIWIKPNDTDGNIMSMSRDKPQNSWNMPPISASNNRFTGKIWNNRRMVSPPFEQGKWYFVCLIWSSLNSTQYLYLNGELIDSESGISYSSSGADNYLYFGQTNPGANDTGSFAGGYGNIMVYDGKPLSESEIKQNFEATRSRYGI